MLASLESVVRRYPRVEGGEEHTVLDGVDLAVEAGESIAIVGPSGSGKTTLLHLLGGLEHPTAGRALFEGEDLAAKDARALAALRNEKLGLVFQAHHLLPQCSALENVLVPTLARGRRRAAAERDAALKRARTLLERVGLGPRLAHRPGQLSGGECQRVAVVRALIHRPRLVLADEPTGSLDGRAAEALADLFCELNNEEGTALVTVTHSPDLAARMGRVLRLRDGRLAPEAARA